MTKTGKAKPRMIIGWAFLVASLASIVGFLATINWRFFIPMTGCWFIAVLIFPKEADRDG